MDHIVTLDGYQEAAPSGHGGKLTVSFGSQQSAGPAASGGNLTLGTRRERPIRTLSDLPSMWSYGRP